MMFAAQVEALVVDNARLQMAIRDAEAGCDTVGAQLAHAAGGLAQQRNCNMQLTAGLQVLGISSVV